MKIGLALGGGAARGNAHIGVINALTAIGIRPDIICGCSIGALIGASYASGNLYRLEEWMRALSRRSMLRYFELNPMGGSLISNTAFDGFLTRQVCESTRTIDSLDTAFAAVATELVSGREVWLDSGSVLDAVRASIALPGLFRPLRHPKGWLVDGGLVNPVPVSMCRALGADAVIAVNLNADIVGKHFAGSTSSIARDQTGSGRGKQASRHALRKRGTGFSSASNSESSWSGWVSTTVDGWLEEVFNRRNGDAGSLSPNDPPGLLDTLASAFNIMQDRITRSRMAGDPPNMVLSPRLAHIGLMEFYRADSAISEGAASVERMSSEIEHVLGRSNASSE